MYFAPMAIEPGLHIPDGFLSVGVAICFWAISLVFILVGTRRVQRSFDERLIPLMGIMAAFIFAAQMINFPVAGGTSGHLLGGALAAILLGPWAGMLAMTAVVVVQALLFQDGGLLVMGANIFNMGILTALVGFGIYRSFAGASVRLQMVAIGLAAWLSVMAAALTTSLQLWLSGTSALRLVVPAMMGVHALIGVGEALITVAAYGFIRRLRPDLVSGGAVRARGGKSWVGVALAATLLVVFLTPLASANPDGLERVARDLGFVDAARPSPLRLLANYRIPLLADSALATIAAALVGLVAVSGTVLLLLVLLRRFDRLQGRRADA